MKDKKYLKIKDLPESLRPYEKCEQFGTNALSDAELLSVIIRSGSAGERSTDLATRILKQNNNAGLMNLHHMTLEELRDINGIGRVKSIQLKCICELTERISRQTRSHGEQYTDPEMVAGIYMESMRYLEREKLIIIMLDTKSRLIKDLVISTGTINSSIASSREIFYEALRNGAVSIILLHNHPSGDPMPSKDDLLITENIIKAGQIMGIPLSDHIIIGDNCYFSMREAGYIE